MVDGRKPVNKPSGAWYLLPIFLGLIGGVIGYFVVKDRDKAMAEKMLIVGLIMTVVVPVLFIIPAMFYALGVFSPTVGARTTCAGFSYFSYNDHVLRDDGTFSIVVYNGNQDVTITGLSVEGQDLLIMPMDTVDVAKKTTIVGNGFFSSKSAGDPYTYTIIITYNTNDITGKTDMATCTGTIY